MDPEHVISLYDSCWFNQEIFKKQSAFTSTSDTMLNKQVQEYPSILMRSKNCHLSSTTGFDSDCLSPNSVLFTPHLQTIFSEEEFSQKKPMTQLQNIEEKVQQPEKNRGKSKRKNKGTTSTRLQELELEELKGFMDLGFVFSEEDKNSSLAKIIPGLRRLGKQSIEGDQEDESRNTDVSLVPRPYLSEAWDVVERMNRENPLMNWRVPASNNEIDMKDSLKWWAHTVASIVR